MKNLKCTVCMNMKWIPAFAGITALLFLSSLTPLNAMIQIQSTDGQMIEAVDNQVLVIYKKGRPSTLRSQTVGALGARVQGQLEKINVDIVRVPPGDTVQSFIQKLKAISEDIDVEPNGLLRALDTPNDPDYANQYALQTNLLNMPSAWDITQGNSSVVIADLDTGVLLTHSDLSGNLWTNPAPSGNSGLRGTRIQIDFNGDGDCLDTDTEAGPEQCASSDPTDNSTGGSGFHGTRIAGIMAAVTNNGVNMAGIARNCKIMAVKVLNSAGSGTFAAVAEGIIYAADNGASVINLSLGGDTASAATTAAVDYAISKNVVVVAAAGNTRGTQSSCSINFPASIDRVIAVGATNSSDQLASFSCTGTALDLVAPGVSILSTTLGGTSSANVDGTSFAAPMVSAVAALMRSLQPTLSVEDVTRYINFNTKDLGSGGFDTSFGFGRLDAFKTIQAVNNRTPLISNPASPGETFPYPNPFNPLSGRLLAISVPESLGSDGLKIEIHTLSGERVKTLTGTNTWDGRNDEGEWVASGLYIYFLKTTKGDTKGKLTVLK